MALVLADRVRDTTTTTGTGTVTLSGTAPTGYQNFSVVGNGNTTYYTINAGSQWEVGIGTYSSTGPTLSRDTILASSSAGAAVDFAAGTKDVFVTYPAEKSVNYDANGNVGIGTTAPTKTLMVSSGGTSTPAQGGLAGVLIANTDLTASGTSGITGALYDPGGTGRHAAAIAFGKDGTWTAGAAYPGNIQFWTRPNSTADEVERMRIDSSGNVGIGTSSPASKLDIGSGDLRFSSAGQRILGDFSNATFANRVAIQTTTANSNTGVSIIPSASGFNAALNLETDPTFASGSVLQLVAVASSDARINSGNRGSGTYLPMTFYTNGSERMRLDTSGNLGIGTSSPTQKLEVNGQTVTGNITVKGDGSEGGQITLNNAANSAGVYAFDVDGSGHGRIFTVTNNTNLTLGQLSGTGGIFAVYTGAAERMRIDSSGNVGIGTSAPTSLLHVKRGSNATERYPSGTWASQIINATDAGAENGLVVGNRWAASSSTVFEAGSIYGNGSLYWSSYYKIDGVGQHFWGYGASGLEGMRLNTSGNVGIGTSAPTFKLQVAGNFYTSSNVQFYDQDGFRFASAAAYTSMRIGSSYTGESTGELAYDRTNGAFTYKQGNTGSTLTERMRIDASGNVGIGTSSPSSILHTVAVGSEIRSENTSTAQYQSGRVRLKGPAGTYRSTNLVHGNDNVGGTNTYFAIEGANSSDNYLQTLALYNYASQYWLFSTNSTERMRIDSSGNVGIGTGNVLSRLDISETTRVRWYLGTAGLINIEYTNAAANTYVTHRMQALDHQFYTNGNERMRIDGSGNVGIGTSSPQSKMEIRSTSGGSVVNALTLSNYVGASVGTGVALHFDPNGAGSLARAASIQSVQATSGNFADLRFFTANSDTPAERMRITPAGNVGIGTTSPGRKLEVTGDAYISSGLYTGTSIYTGFATSTGDCAIELGGGRSDSGNAYLDLHAQAGQDFSSRIIRYPGANGGMDIINSGTGGMVLSLSGAAPIVFQTSGAERARITSDGHFLVGTTTGGPGYTNSNTGFDAYIDGTTYVSKTGNISMVVNNNTSGNQLIWFGYQGTNKGSIALNGTASVLYNTTSDVRLKNNIRSAEDASALIDAIQVRQYDWKADGSHQRYGFIAQELIEVAPEAVYQPEDEDEMMGVDYAKLVPMMLKELQSLRARVAQLEGK